MSQMASLRSLLRDAEVTQGQLCRSVGCDATTFNDWIMGRRQPSLQSFAKILAGLKRYRPETTAEELLAAFLPRYK